MRLIDADELIGDVLSAKQNFIGSQSEVYQHELICDNVVRWIDYANTVEAVPVRHGKWHYDEDAGGYLCSVCDGYTYELIGDGIETDKGAKWVEILSNYCHHCGARMDGENHETD